MNKITIQHFKTIFGELLLGAFNDQLCLCDWRYRKMRKAIDTRIISGLNANYIEEETRFLNNVIVQLNEYIKGTRTTFDIPVLMVGSPFQKSVWEELVKIPYGSTETYLGISNKLNNPKAIRAVASANGANAISVIVPCHRIIGSDGNLVGYAGGIDVKSKLLTLEGAILFS